MEMRIVKNKIERKELKGIAKRQFGDFVKAVVDVRQGIMALAGELHADLEVLLTEKEDSRREDTWGVNLYPEEAGEDFIEFDSMINVKPAFGNRSRGVDNPQIRDKVKGVVHNLVSD